MIQNILDLTQVETHFSTCLHQTQFQFAQLQVRFHATERGLIEDLTEYYKSYLHETQAATSIIDVYVMEQAPAGDELAWLEVPREVGKQGRKEGYLDVPGGRWIKKFKTGMSFLQRPDQLVAVGPCAANLAQIINFINNQFLNHFLRQDFTLGHASAFSVQGQVTAIAAGSGGGKSTLMLRCLEKSTRDFLTNDRILLKRVGSGTETIGLAKLPRVNPGTLLYSDRLRHILPAARQQALSSMPTSELWSLEEKYDVQIEDDYGANRVQLTGQLVNLIMLDWSLDSPEETRLEQVDLSQEPDVIEGLRKRPGPFYQDNQGVFADLNAIDSTAHYVDQLANVAVYRLTGKIDFDLGYQLIGQLATA
ncbi:HprK-related kinase B [Marinomonas posidonica]|uniref:HprK-related kinase B n=1 Tax=Marinomonas posidonica TaxID=936476 RepID=UPI0037359A1D